MRAMHAMAFRLGRTLIVLSLCLFLAVPGGICAGSLTEEIWKESYPDYQKILTMPFNRELSDGVLDEKVFKSFIIQDYFFLQNLRKVYGILLSKTPDEEGTRFILEALKGIDEETVRIHTVYFKKFGITNEDLSKAIVYPNTEFYNSFLIKMAVLEPFEVGLIATLPCHWIYYRIGADMKKAKPSSPNKYQDWIDGYGTSSWETSETRRFVDLIERYLTKTSGETREKMKKAYATAVKLEYMFWDGVYRDLQWLP